MSSEIERAHEGKPSELFALCMEFRMAQTQSAINRAYDKIAAYHASRTAERPQGSGDVHVEGSAPRVSLDAPAAEHPTGEAPAPKVNLLRQRYYTIGDCAYPERRHHERRQGERRCAHVSTFHPLKPISGGRRRDRRTADRRKA